MNDASSSSNLSVLRSLLLSLPPTGAAGFEGLVATCLAEVSGLVLRLARSGSQFGRDASSTPGNFAIAMEAKRYSTDLRLEEIAGKAVLAAQMLDDVVDLWVLGATSEVGDDTVLQLTRILNERGISILVLDWGSDAAPLLGVLLAAARTSTEAWLCEHGLAAQVAAVRDALDQIERHQHYAERKRSIAEAMSRSEVGLDSLRLHAMRWLMERFGDRGKSRVSFGQFVTVCQPGSLIEDRTATRNSLHSAVTLDQTGKTLFAVLGEEGVGKTWIVAQWIAAFKHWPIVLFVSGRRLRKLEIDNPMRGIAAILAEQAGFEDERAIRSWQRRLLRWRTTTGTPDPRFVVVWMASMSIRT
jgi:hypothetical protein